MRKVRAIEADSFAFDFISRIAERESWRKEVHRPIYHTHKWWAKRLGSVFRGILLGCCLDEDDDLAAAFYAKHSFTDRAVFDPFLGSGTTVGEAHKLGFSALGRDINPVAVEAVRVALGPLNEGQIEMDFRRLATGVGKRINSLYRSKDTAGRPCDVLYYFWVMQAACPDCQKAVDLFSSYTFCQNACPAKKPETQVVCPDCGDVFPGIYGTTSTTCTSCAFTFNPAAGPAKGQKATCSAGHTFQILDAVAAGAGRPAYRAYAKLVLTKDNDKEYISVTPEDVAAFDACSHVLADAVASGEIVLPNLALTDGFNTRQALGYNFKVWRDFFNDRQLLALGWLHAEIRKIDDPHTRDALLTLFSGALEFNNMFASYKGEGTGAVRHMFSHHILKPERTPIEAHVWGTKRSSGSFSGMYKTRLQRALAYRRNPTEVNGTGSEKGVVCSLPFSGKLAPWPTEGDLGTRAVHLSCGDSSATGLPDACIDLVVTDPPFFDNVHYSELADFFYAWQQINMPGKEHRTTRHPGEVQDTDAASFARKLGDVFRECYRILTADGLLVFSYHHSRDDGWMSVADAVLGSGFQVVNSHPVKAEMSVAMPKSQAKEPIQFDIIIVCRKRAEARPLPLAADAMASARTKLTRMRDAGFKLSKNDAKIVLYGQLLTTLRSAVDADGLAALVRDEMTVTLEAA